MTDTTVPQIPLRRCTKCGEIKPLTEFHKRAASPDGYRPSCKVCRCNQEKQYRSMHREVLNERQRQQQRKHSARIKAYYQANKEVIRLKKQKYNREHKRQNSEYCKRWRTENPERVKGYNTNKEYNAAKSHNRRAAILNARGKWTKQDIALQRRSQNNCCWWCGKKLNERFEVDHRIALSRGGSNAPENLVISCMECNRSKGSKLPQEWNGRLL